MSSKPTITFKKGENLFLTPQGWVLTDNDTTTLKNGDPVLYENLYVGKFESSEKPQRYLFHRLDVSVNAVISSFKRIVGTIFFKIDGIPEITIQQAIEENYIHKKQLIWNEETQKQDLEQLERDAQIYAQGWRDHELQFPYNEENMLNLFVKTQQLESNEILVFNDYLLSLRNKKVPQVIEIEQSVFESKEQNIVYTI